MQETVISTQSLPSSSQLTNPAQTSGKPSKGARDHREKLLNKRDQSKEKRARFKGAQQYENLALDNDYDTDQHFQVQSEYEISFDRAEDLEEIIHPTIPANLACQSEVTGQADLDQDVKI